MDRIAPVFALALLAACGGEAPPPAGADENAPTAEVAPLPDAHELRIDAPREVQTRGGEYVVRWMPVGGAVPVNDHFEVDVEVTNADGAPVTGATVGMTCFMPDHGHGMLREPRSEEVGDGKYRVRGMLLHMDGYWTVAITVVGADGIAATADDELTL